MSTEQQLMKEPGGGKGLYRAGGIAGILFGLAYIAIMGLYLPMGAPPAGAEARLAYTGANPGLWWGILGLSVLTDLLLIPLALALYQVLRGANRSLMLLSVAFIGLFIILDLAVTWTNYAVIIPLAQAYAAADSAGQAALVTAAVYPTAVLESGLLFVYNTFTLSLGILLAGWVMLEAGFNRVTAYLGVATGLFGIVAVFGPYLIPGLSVAIISASLLTTVWALAAGYGLLRLGRA